MITAEIKASIDKSVLCWLATADQAGRPNVSPKQIFLAGGKTFLLIANIASPQSVRNIKINPNVCVSFVDIFTQKGFKLTGKARNIVRIDDDYQRKVAGLEKMAGPDFPIISVIEVEIFKASPILSPRYRFKSDTTEESQIGRAMDDYNVQPNSK